MEYTVNKLAKLAGVSARTLRYYDEIGLLSPVRTRTNGYRVYGQREVDRLQQILFYRELDVPLEEIRRILSAGDFNGKEALEGHLQELLARQRQLEQLVKTVKKTIQAMEGEIVMNDREKFEGFLGTLVEENERRYGEEIREKYGDGAVDGANARLRGMTQEQYIRVEALSQELNETLKAAVEQGDPTGELAQRACGLHKQWLCCYWDHYSPEAHMNLGEMYVADPRFTAYYDGIAPGSAAFLRDALRVFCQ